MSKTPQLNLRVAEEYQDAVRRVADRLRQPDGPDFLAALDAFLDGAEPVQGVASPLAFVALVDEVEELHERLDALQAYMLKRIEKLEAGGASPQPEPQPVRFGAIPDDLLENAAKLRDRAHTWQAVAHMMTSSLGREISENAARNAVDRWRKRQG